MANAWRIAIIKSDLKTIKAILLISYYFIFINSIVIINKLYLNGGCMTALILYNIKGIEYKYIYIIYT